MVQMAQMEQMQAQVQEQDTTLEEIRWEQMLIYFNEDKNISLHTHPTHTHTNANDEMGRVSIAQQPHTYVMRMMVFIEFSLSIFSIVLSKSDLAPPIEPAK